MKRKILAGTTSFIDRVFVRDTSQTSKVAGLTGLTSSSGSLTLYYCRSGAGSSSSVSLSAGTLGTWSSGGFIVVDGTNMPGEYEIGIPNAAVASGAAYVTFRLRGATNMEDISWGYDLDAVNYQDGVRAGLTGLANAAAGAGGGLLLVGSGAGALNVDGSGNYAGSLTSTVLSAIAGSVWNALTASYTTTATFGKLVGSMVNQTGDAYGYLTTNLGSLGANLSHVSANLTQILGTTLTETAGQIAAGFKKLFNVASPTLTADTTGSTLTALGDSRIAHLDADVSSRLATGSYSAPPAAATISTQVGSDLTAAHGSGAWTTATGFATSSQAVAIKAQTDLIATNAADSPNAVTAQTAIANNPDTSGTTTLLTRLPQAAQFDGSGNLKANAETVSDKSGYALSATGLDAISVADPGAIASQTTLPRILVALWRSVFKKHTFTTTQAKFFADDGTTVNATATVSDDGTTQTVGSFS